MLTFTYNSIPPSLNQSLQVSGFRMIHTPKAREYRKETTKDTLSQIKQNISLYNNILTLNETNKLRLTINIMTKWHNKDHTIKHKDIQNLEKLVCDSVFEALNIINNKLNDKQIFTIIMNKIESDTEQTTVTIEVI